jgi:hypothetical protein
MRWISLNPLFFENRFCGGTDAAALPLHKRSGFNGA